MATYSETSSGLEKHGIRAIQTETVIEKFASLWIKTATGLQKIYEAVKSCYGSGRWRYDKRFVYNDRWRY